MLVGVPKPDESTAVVSALQALSCFTDITQATAHFIHSDWAITWRAFSPEKQAGSDCDSGIERDSFVAVRTLLKPLISVAAALLMPWNGALAEDGEMPRKVRI